MNYLQDYINRTYKNPTTRRIMLSLLEPTEPTAEQKQAQFIANYQEPYSFGKALKSDVGSFMGSLYKIPLSIWDTIKQSLAATGMYDTSKPLWEQQPTREMKLKNLKMGALQMIPGFSTLETISHLPYVENTALGKAIPKTPVSEILNRFLFNSIVKNTGKWIYNPEAQTRRWFTPLSDPTSRFQELKERPFSTLLEDISNLAIVGAPIAKATGLSAKVSSAVKATKPYQILESKVLTPLAQRSKFLDIVSNMKQKQFQRVEELRHGKLVEALKGVSKEQQPELEALITRRAELLPGMEGTENLSKALSAYEKSAEIETKSLIKKGLLKEGQHEKAVWKEYTDEFGKSIDELRELGIKEPIYYPHTFEKYPKFGFAKLKQTKAGYLKTKTGVAGWEEPIVSIPKHKIEFITQKTVGEALKEIENNFGKPIVNGEILPGYVKWNPKQFNLEFFPVERVSEAGTKLKPLIAVKKFKPKLQIPKFLNDEIVRMTTPITGMAKTFGAVWDAATNTWKVSVLALSPRWIFNNIMGNSILNVLAGVVDPMSYIEAGKRLYKGWKESKTQDITFARAMSRQHIPESVWEGLYRAEARAATPSKGLAESWLTAEAAPVTSKWAKLGYKISEVPKAMYRLNSTIESFYRTAHYLDKIKFGLTPAKALASVNEFLFDYSRLSTIEKAFIRRALPFYSWQKNITRLAISYPFKHPTGMAVLQKLQKVTEEAQTDDKLMNFLPDWFKNYYIKTPFKQGNENLYLSTRGINPFADIGMFGEGASSYLSALNPLIKIPLERMTGQNFYKGKPFTSPYSDILSYDKTLPSLWRHIASNFPQYGMLENLIKPYAKYDTGEPILDKNGNYKYDKSRLLTILKMIGINLSPYDTDEMVKQKVNELMRKETIKSNYNKKLELNKEINNGSTATLTQEDFLKKT